MRRARKTVGAVLVLAGCALGILSTNCHVLEDVSDCEENLDCPLGQACNPNGKFCETKSHIVFGALYADPSISDNREIQKRALDLVTSVVNDNGGVLGKPIEFKVMPDRPNEVTLSSMSFFVDEERVAGIIGGTNSSVALLMQKQAAPAKILNISAQATAPELSTAEPAVDRYFFRTTATSRHGEALAQALYSRSGSTPLCKNTFMVDDDSAFGKAYREAYRETFTKLGGCFVGSTVVASSAKSDYADVVEQLKAAVPDCLLIALFDNVGPVFVREVKDALAADKAHDWSKLTWLSGSPSYSSNFLTLDAIDPAKPEVQAAEGMHISATDTAPPTPEYFRFRSFFNEYYGRPTDQDTEPDVSSTYDAAVLLALAVKRANSLDRVAIRDALWHVVTDSDGAGVYGPTEVVEMLRILTLREGEPTCVQESHYAPCEVRYRGASSPLLFDEYGTVSTPAAIYRVKGNGFELEKRYSVDEFSAFEAAPARPAPKCPAP